MVSIIKKKRNDKSYYYLVESQRVNGKPRIVWQKYLGTAETLKNKLEDMDFKVKKASVLEFGLAVSLYSIAEELELIKIIDNKVTKRNQDVSVGTYITLIAISRCLGVASKNQIKKWYKSTIFPRLLHLPPKKLIAQDVCNNMKYLTEETIAEIEFELLKHIIEKYDIDLDCLFYDPTNFYTYFDEFTESDLAKRGKNKARRYDLRQINTALFVSRKDGIPLLHSTYEGNINDVTQFKTEIKHLMDNLLDVSKKCEKITLIFDKGNNSDVAFQEINSKQRISFVGSLRPSTYKDLLKNIQPFEYKKIYKDDKGKSIYAYRQKMEVFGLERTIVVTFDKKNKKRKILLLLKRIRNRLANIEAFKPKINTKKWRSKENVEKKLDSLLNHGSTKDLFDISVKGTYGNLTIDYKLNRDKLDDKMYNAGKNILFTDNHDWSTEEIVKAYRSKSIIEERFAELNNVRLIPVKPIFHRKDDMIRVHIYTCILGLLLESLLRMKVRKAELKLSLGQITDELKEIKEIIFKTGAKNQIRRTLTEFSPIQKELYTLLKLDRFAP